MVGQPDPVKDQTASGEEGIGGSGVGGMVERVGK